MSADQRAAAGLLLVEIGNSHVSVATVELERIGPPHRLDQQHHDAELLAPHVGAAWARLSTQRPRAIVIASVVPTATADITGQLERQLHVQPMQVGRDLDVPIDVAIDAPDSVGIDRLCAAAAAYAEIQAACVVAGFGTATTIDCVDGQGAFRGGAILPGLGLQSWSLHERTAQLPQVEITPPSRVYGQHTVEAINNGIVYGAAGALREIVERYATDLGRWPRLVLTGGYGPLMKQMCDFADALVPDLVLRGMALAYRRAFSAA